MIDQDDIFDNNNPGNNPINNNPNNVNNNDNNNNNDIINPNNDPNIITNPAVNVAQETFIWGTNIKLEEVRAQFLTFFKTFKARHSTLGHTNPDTNRATWADTDEDHFTRLHDENSSNSSNSTTTLNYDDTDDINGDTDDDDTEDMPPLYPELARSSILRQEWCVNVDCKNVYRYSSSLYRQLVLFPSQVIPIMDVAFNEMVQCLLREDRELSAIVSMMLSSVEDMPRFQVRVFNLRETKVMRKLGPEDIDQLVSIRGMVVRASCVIPNMRAAFFRCDVCNSTEEVEVDIRDRIAEPTVCSRCHSRMSMGIVHNRCTFSDKQVLRLQETPESIPEGETPQTVTLFAFDSLVDAVKPGDRVKITGIFRAEPVRVKPTQRSVRSLYRTFIDVIHYALSDPSKKSSSSSSLKGPLGSETNQFSYLNDDVNDDVNNDVIGGDDDITEAQRAENEARLRRIAEEGGGGEAVYERLTRSIAPNVWELDDIKKGLLCQLFGGTAKEFSSGQRFRGEINILLCGDPGTSKSQLLTFVHKIAPRGVYTSGKGSSAVGLTAYVSRDPDTNDAVLESGALVLSDRGICCIDEFDKMTEYTRAVLHEVMEQQTVSIAKSGIVCVLNARTAVLASANPRESRYNPHLSVVENLQLPPTLLSRFDLIYLVLDKPDEAFDRRLGAHLVSLFSAAPPQPRDVIDLETLSAYIAYAKKVCHPRISDEAKELLVSGYVGMRMQGFTGGRKTVAATPRQLESLIRTSEALARMKLQDTVTEVEVNEALRLVKCALQQAATDPVTGTLDMDLITTGRSAASRGAVRQLAQDVLGVLREAPPELQPMRVGVLAQRFAEVRGGGVAPNGNDLRDALTLLKQDGVIEMNMNFGGIRLVQN